MTERDWLILCWLLAVVVGVEQIVGRLERVVVAQEDTEPLLAKA
jgi:hypothetical protein